MGVTDIRTLAQKVPNVDQSSTSSSHTTLTETMLKTSALIHKSRNHAICQLERDVESNPQTLPVVPLECTVHNGDGAVLTNNGSIPDKRNTLMTTAENKRCN